jgi:hypothetical protein
MLIKTMGILLEKKGSKLSHNSKKVNSNITSIRDGFVKLSKEQAEKLRPKDAYEYIF